MFPAYRLLIISPYYRSLGEPSNVRLFVWLLFRYFCASKERDLTSKMPRGSTGISLERPLETLNVKTTDEDTSLENFAREKLTIETFTSITVDARIIAKDVKFRVFTAICQPTSIIQISLDEFMQPTFEDVWCFYLFLSNFSKDHQWYPEITKTARQRHTQKTRRVKSTLRNLQISETYASPLTFPENCELV